MAQKEGITCPNCENQFDKDFDFCPHCGQVNKKQNLNIGYFISEFLSANFNLDSKIYQTFKLLIYSPAKLTTDFFAGKRTRYIPPVRLYLLISLVYFFVLSISLQNKSDDVLIAPSIVTEDTKDSIAYSHENLDSVLSEMEANKDSVDVAERMIISKLKALNSDAGKRSFKQMLQKYTSLGMFILIPLTALIFFMLFHKNTYYIEHLIFSIQLQSLVFLLFTIFNLIELLFQSNWFTYIEYALLLIILFTWIKSYYKLRIGKTIMKLLTFLIMYSVLLIMFFTFILGFSFFNL